MVRGLWSCSAKPARLSVKAATVNTHHLGAMEAGEPEHLWEMECSS